MAVIESLEEALSIMGEQCLLCKGIGLNGIYQSTRREEDKLIFQCNRGTGHELAFGIGHELTFGIRLESSKVQIKEILNYINSTGKGEEQLTLYRKLETAVKLLSSDSEFELDGKCNRCCNPAVLEIKERKILYNCSTCRISGQESYDVDIIRYD